MRSTRFLIGLVSAICFSSCGKPPEPTPPPVAIPSGPAGLLETSPADAWDDTSLRVMLTDVAVLDEGGDAPKLAFEILAFDADDRPVTSLDPQQLALTLDGLYVPGSWQVQTFREASRAVALGLLFPSHASYSEPVDPEGGLEIRPVEAIAAGAKTLFAGLSEQDRVAVFTYDENSFKRLSDWASPQVALEALGNLPGPSEKPRIAPSFYRAVSKAATDFREAEGLPARRVLLAVSDGADPVSDRPAAVARMLNGAMEAAVSANVHPWLVGFTLNVPEPLLDMKVLASKTDGRYHEVSVEDYAAFGDRIAAFGATAGQGFVVTLTPAPGVRLPKKATDVRLALRASAGVGRVNHYDPLTLP